MVTANTVTHPSVPPRSVRAVTGPLSKWELSWALAAFSGLFPRGAHAEIIGIEDLDVAPSLQSLLLAAPARAVLGIRVALLVTMLAPLFVVGRFATLGGLESEARSEVMARLLASSIYPVRQLALLLKMIGSFLFARTPEVKRVLLRARTIPVPAESGSRLIESTALVRGGRDARRIA